MDRIKERNSSFELMRIISMLLVITSHVIGHGGLFPNSIGNLHISLVLVKCITKVYVNPFILIMGYCQYKSTFKLNKLFKINNAAWFYNFIITVVFIVLGISEISNLQILKNFSPIILNDYWFIRLYIYLYCLSPFINILIRNIDKKTHKNILIVCFVLFSILPTITYQQLFNNEIGRSLSTFIFLYLTGAYFAKYPIDKSTIMSLFTRNGQKLIFVSIFILCFLINFSIFWLSIRLLKSGEIISYFGQTIRASIFTNDNPLVIIGSISYFLCFYYMKFYSKFINFVASLTIGIYLIHEMPLVREPLYTFLGLLPNGSISSYVWLLKMFIAVFAIFIGCGIIEWLRQLLFKWIYNWKISRKLSSKFYNYLDSLKPID